MDASKLTRVLDTMGNQGFIVRTLNHEDRRSFLITPTERGIQLLEVFTNQLKDLSEGMLVTLTPIERLILIELFTKIQTNWTQSPNS